MSVLRVLVLSVVQGLAELLPISSSAHVVVAEKLMGMDPSAPEMTLLLVSLHTGTMLAVIVYFWTRWRRTFFRTREGFTELATLLVLPTAVTGLVGGVLVMAVENVLLRRDPRQAEVEQLFSHLELIAPALALVGVLIVMASVLDARRARTDEGPALTSEQALLIGAVQGLSLPFRGFSRSGATISTGMLAGVDKRRAEEFSFALAVILTPVVVIREAWRLIKAGHLSQVNLTSTIMMDLLGALCAFVVGVLALKWLSRWLENGRWYWFGLYCLVASGAVALLHYAGY